MKPPKSGRKAERALKNLSVSQVRGATAARVVGGKGKKSSGGTTTPSPK